MDGVGPNTIVGWLTTAGPYAVTLIVLVWLWLERRERLEVSRENDALRDKMIEMAQSGATTLAELGEATRDRLRQVEDRVDAALRLIRDDRDPPPPRRR